MVTDVLPTVANALLMVYPMIARESSVANLQKVAKIDENCVVNTALDLKQLMNNPIPRY